MPQTQSNCMSYDNGPTDPEGLEDADGERGTDEAQHDEDCDPDAQDGAGDEEDDAEGDDSDPDEPQRHGKPQASTAHAWEIIQAERNEAAGWRTVREPVPDARFPTIDRAFDYRTRLNCRDFGKRFDWMCNPGRAWLAVRVGTRGKL